MRVPIIRCFVFAGEAVRYIKIPKAKNLPISIGNAPFAVKLLQRQSARFHLEAEAVYARIAAENNILLDSVHCGGIAQIHTLSERIRIRNGIAQYLRIDMPRRHIRYRLDLHLTVFV